VQDFGVLSLSSVCCWWVKAGIAATALILLLICSCARPLHCTLYPPAALYHLLPIVDTGAESISAPGAKELLVAQMATYHPRLMLLTAR
jgi:hypothetical protein